MLNVYWINKHWIPYWNFQFTGIQTLDIGTFTKLYFIRQTFKYRHTDILELLLNIGTLDIKTFKHWYTDIGYIGTFTRHKTLDIGTFTIYKHWIETLPQTKH